MTMPSKSEILAVAVNLRTVRTLDLRGLPVERRRGVELAIRENNELSKRAADVLDRILSALEGQ